MKSISKLSLTALSCFVLTSCSIQYTPASSVDKYGYYSQPVPNGLTEVSFRGNIGFITSTMKEARQTVMNYTMRRIAELGVQKNKKYVSIYQSIEDAALDDKSQEPAATLTPLGNYRSYAYVRFNNVKQYGDLSIAALHKKYSAR